MPDWAIKPVTALGNNHRRLEGLIAPGAWNVDPSGSAQQILATLVAESADHYVTGGLLDTATAMNMSPYEILIVGSLVQREASRTTSPRSPASSTTGWPRRSVSSSTPR